MILLKKDVSKDRLTDFGFVRSNDNIMEKVVGVLSIYYDAVTRKFSGLGFYPVGDSIVLRNIQELVDNNLVDIY